MAGAAAIALVATLAAVWPGYDAQQTPLDDGTIWALQRSAGGHYARVNTELGELDTVKAVSQPTALANTPDGLWVFASGATRVARVDPARPPDLDSDAAELFQPTPDGTREVIASGDHLAYLTESGEIYTGMLGRPGSTLLQASGADTAQAEGADDEAAQRFVADAVTVGPGGSLAAYSATAAAVLRADAVTGEILGLDQLEITPGDDVQVTMVGDRWVMLEPESGRVWISGLAAPIATELAPGARLAQPATGGDEVFIADERGVVAVAIGTGAVRAAFGGAQTLGTPAAPLVAGDTTFTAWLPAAGAGVLWGSDGTQESLDFAGAELSADPLPEFVSNGSRVIVNETQSGWVWTMPDGELVPSSQRWQAEDDATLAQAEDAVAPRVLDPKPPVAVDDAFGVRAGRAVTLPVLLNDHDPNEDVLTVIPDSVSAAAFGEVRTTNADQQLVVDVPVGATGSTSLTYRITDGTTADGLNSAAATVALTVIEEDQNSAPVWCAAVDCLATWPEPSIAPGGTVRFSVLDGFVDPEGDAMYVEGAVVDSGPGAVTVDPAGVVTYQHPDPNSDAASIVSVRVSVSDIRGARTERNVEIAVSPTPRLEAESFAVTAIVGRPLAVDLESRIRGAAGTPTLAAVTAAQDDAALTVNTTGLSFVYTPDQPGSTVLQYTVRDGDTEQTATVRVSALTAAAAAISAPPLVAFVRPGEDTTVDVLDAVFNPAGLVLLLSDLRPEPVPGSTLSVDPVGQSTIRASGSTADSAPGELGVVRYTISDGSGDPATAITGQLTVVLLASAGADPPIAVDDTATVRAGAQIDIPVLDNDTAPTGGLLAIDPSRVVNDSGAGLAFATSRMLRYLAPEQAGIYSVSYTVSRLGFPELTDTAHVRITVLADDTNTAPAPRTLEGRSLSGRSTTILFDSFGIDPDGDAVALDAVIDQPVAADGTPAGTATVSADGGSLVYTAPPTWSGQASFTYRVRDARGATATALALVGVRDAQSDPRPVTFSDYVQIEGGTARANSVVTVTPLENDVDPSGTDLTLLDVRPNAPVGTAEYRQMEELLAEVDTNAASVTLRSSEALGTSSFIYTAANASGDTAMGLIVLKVVRNPVPDYPDVRDTILTAETIDDFADGIDVLTDKVSWRGGDPATLTLALWTDIPGVRVDGVRILGQPRDEALLVPFVVSGTGFNGEAVTSYGFLRVPGEADVRPTVRAGTGAFTVGENESVDIDLASIIAVPRAGVLELDAAIATGGARATASCELIGPTTLRYAAGSGSPWTDTCTVPARLVGQEDWGYLTIRLIVEAEAPQPILTAASRTLGPGQSETIDLREFTSWTGAPNWSAIRYAVEYSGDQFQVTLRGSSLEVVGADDARPGRSEPVVVRLESHPDADVSTLTLVVGPAPSTLPKAGTVTQQCSQSGGTTSCLIPVIGAAGEVNPLPGTPLKVAEVTDPVGCPAVTFSVADASSVRASWTADAPGAADCTGTVIVADAQGRLSSGERAGTVILDLRGLPADPATIEWVDFDESSVTLRVSSASTSYPAVEGYRVNGNGIDIRCDADGICPAVDAEIGQKIAYRAWAVNSVGESRAATTPVTAWAYAAPEAPATVAAAPVPTADGTGNIAAVTVGGFDPTTGSIRVTSPVTGGSQTVAVPDGASEVTLPEVVVGANRETSLTVTPLSRFDYPSIAAGSTEGSSRTVTAWGVGAPNLNLSLEPSDDGSGDVRAVATVTANGVDTFLDVGISTTPSCTPAPVGEMVAAVVEQTIAGTAWDETTVYACAQYRVGSSSFGVALVGPVTAIPTEPIPAPVGSATYTVVPTPVVDGSRVSWTQVTGPSFPHPRYETRYAPGAVTVFADLFTIGVDPGAIDASWCVGSACSAASTPVVPTGAAYTARADFPTTCDAVGAPAETSVDADPADYSLSQVGTPSADGSRIDWEIMLTWTGRLSGLDSHTYTGLSCPAPTP